MGIYDNNAFAFTGDVKPIILPYTRPQAYDLNQGRMASGNAEERREDDTKYMGVDVTKVNEGLHGQNEVQQQQLIGLEGMKNELRQRSRQAIINAKTEAERTQALDNYTKGLNYLKNQALNVQLHAEEYKEDRIKHSDDEKYAAENGLSQSTALMMDFGKITGADQRLSNGTTVAQNRLWDESINGVVATNRKGQAMSKDEYLWTAENDNQSLDSQGMPVRYRRFVRESKESDYKDNISKGLTGLGTRAGDSFQMVADNGSKVSVSDAEMDAIYNLGMGYVKTTSSSNAVALKHAINNAYDHMTSEDRNTAFVKMVQSGSVIGEQRFTVGKKTEILKAQSAENAVVDLQRTRQEYAKEKDPDRREYLRQKGLALSAALINGTKRQVYRDASGYYSEKLETRSSREFARPTQAHADAVAMNRAMAELNPAMIKVSQSMTPGDNLWMNGVNMQLNTAYNAYTRSNVAQVSYLKNMGIDLNKKDYSANPKSLLDLSQQFVLNNHVYDAATMDANTQKFFKHMKIVGVGNHVRVLPTITNGQVDQRALTSYAQVQVIIPKDAMNGIQQGRVVRQENGVMLSGTDQGKKVRYKETDEKYSLKRMISAKMLHDVKYDEDLGQYVGHVYVPLNAEGAYTEGASLTNTKMMRNAIKEGEAGWARSGDKVFSADDLVGSAGNDQWISPNEQLDKDITPQTKRERIKENKYNSDWVL